MSSNQEKQPPKLYWWPEGRKLIFLREKATADFWDRHWQADEWRKRITRSRHSRYWSRILKKYLPNKNSRILDGGCGYGHIVDAMDYWGYGAFGVDFAQETVAKVKEAMPNLNVRYGDVRALDCDNEYFDGYWSVGVIEHFWEGYDDILREMKRVLKVGGYAFVTFPCISRLDRLQIILSRYRRFTDDHMPGDFYQFGLDISTVTKDFEHMGFECVRIQRRNGWEGLKRIWPASERIRALLSRLGEKSRVIKLFLEGMSFLMAPVCGHSALLVLRKR